MPCSGGPPQVRMPRSVMSDVTADLCVFVQLSRAQVTISGFAKTTSGTRGSSGKLLASF